MMSAIQRIARGVFFPRESAAAAPERSQFDYDSFEHVEGLHLPADQCWRSSSLDAFGEEPGYGRHAGGTASAPAAKPSGARRAVSD